MSCLVWKHVAGLVIGMGTPFRLGLGSSQKNFWHTAQNGKWQQKWPLTHNENNKMPEHCDRKIPLQHG